MISARKAVAADEADMLAWRNDPVTRRNSRDTAPVSPETNAEWFRRSLEADDRIILILEDERGKVGVVRFDEAAAGAFEVSINVNPDRRGEGLSGPILAASIDWLRGTRPIRVLLADIRVDNLPSRKCFESNDFLLLETEEGFHRFVREFADG